MVDILIPNLQELKSMQLETVDADSLIDIKDVRVNTDLPVSERFIDYLEQIKNPYLYKHGKTVVKISFSDTDITLEERLKSYFASL
jgi:hypothetical protein